MLKTNFTIKGDLQLDVLCHVTTTCKIVFFLDEVGEERKGMQRGYAYPVRTS